MIRRSVDAKAFPKILSAVALARILVIASFVGPAAILGVLAWLTYQSAFADAERDLIWTGDVAREHASKVFDSYKLVAERVRDLSGRVPDEQIRASEGFYYISARQIIEGLPQIESLLVVDREGQPLFATAGFPVERATSFADRDYFVALREGKTDTYISKVQTSRVSGIEFFGWGRTRRSPDGAFDGVIGIALSPAFFMRFYETLLREVGRGTEGRVVTMLRDDGQILVRYPALPGAIAPVPASNPFFEAARKHPDGGIYTNRSVVDRGAPERLYAFRRVPGHPIYVVTGRSIAAIVGEWRRSMAKYLFAGAAATIVLFLISLISLITLRSARREQAAFGQLSDEVRKREVIEGQLHQARKMEAIGQLAGGVAHDFNNLLTIVRSSTELLRRPSLSATARDRYLDGILETTARGAKLTDQLLSFAQRELLQPEVFDVTENLNKILTIVRTLTGPGIEVQLHVPPGPLRISADSTQFDTAIINLAANARDAMNGQGVLSISAEMKASAVATGPVADHVLIELTDTGSGIATEHLDRIFEPFFTTKAIGEGTGLGLAQVFGFARQSGGQVRVQSEVGVGSTFTLLLPLVLGA